MIFSQEQNKKNRVFISVSLSIFTLVLLSVSLSIFTLCFHSPFSLFIFTLCFHSLFSLFIFTLCFHSSFSLSLETSQCHQKWNTTCLLQEINKFVKVFPRMNIDYCDRNHALAIFEARTV
jgi:hypothetical protein